MFCRRCKGKKKDHKNVMICKHMETEGTYNFAGAVYGPVFCRLCWSRLVLFPSQIFLSEQYWMSIAAWTDLRVDRCAYLPQIL